MEEFEVYRNNKHIGTVDASTAEEAINKAIKNRQNEEFGQAGAMTDSQKAAEDEFLDAKFTAKKAVEKGSRKKIRIDREEFVGWRYSTTEDYESLAGDIQNDLSKSGEFILDMERIWQNTGYCSSCFILNPEDVPDKHKQDWDKETGDFEIHPDQVPFDEIEFVLVKKNEKSGTEDQKLAKS